MRTIALILLALPMYAQEAEHNHANQPAGKVLQLPRDLEIRLAVTALPPHLREGAGILVPATKATQRYEKN